MNEFDLDSEYRHLYFNRSVVLDLSGNESPGFRVMAAGTPPFHRRCDGCFVGIVTHGSEASRKMLIPGDYILLINGKDASNFTVEQVQECISRGGSVKLVVECCAVAKLQTEPISLFKVREKTTLPRKYWVNDAATRLFWNSRVKRKENASIKVSALKEVRLGRKTHSFERAYSKLGRNSKNSMGGEGEKLCASIIHGEEFEPLDLVFNALLDFHVFVIACQYFVRQNKNYALSDIPHEENSSRTRWLKDIFEQADVNHDNQLSLKEIKVLLRKLNMRISSKVLSKKFYTADTDSKGTVGYGLLDFKEFVQFYKLLVTRSEIGEIMTSFGNATVDRGDFNAFSMQLDTYDDVSLTAEQLQHFFQSSQHEVYSLEECMEMIATFEPAKTDGTLGIDGFTRILSSTLGAAYSYDNRRRIYQNMTEPLSHYFIASSHNTYLLQDQLRGPSDVEAYKRALLTGCRCVELDLWDGDESYDFKPVIYHGYTLTSKVYARDVLEACKNYAFATSDYPLILSLENHLGIDQQKVFAADCQDVFGDLLYVISPDVEVLPSPEDLKRKIILKGKRLNAEGDSVDDENESLDNLYDPEFLELARRQKVVRQRLESEVRKQGADLQKSRKVKLAQEFSDIVSLAGKKFKQEQLQALSEQKCTEMSSFVEGKAEKLCKEGSSAPLFVRRNVRQLARVYPAGRRIDSTNYNPHAMWCAGCQIVALNYQTACKEMNLNFGKFRDNGGCGYVLKPKELCDPQSKFNPTVPSTVSIEKLETVTIRVISAQNLPKPNQCAHDTKKGEIIDPYVGISVFGLPGESTESTTSVVQNNGLNPRWQSSDVCQFDVSFPDVALLRFRVMDKDYLSKDDFVAQAVIPLKCLKEGFRHVQLYTLANTPIDQCSLFIHVRHSPFGGNGFSARSKFSVRPHAPLDIEEQQVGRKTGIPEIDSAYRTAPMADVESLHNNLLRSVENLRKHLRVDPSLPFIDCIKKFVSELEKEGCSMNILPVNVFGGMVLNVSASKQTKNSKPATRIFAGMQKAMASVYTSNDSLSAKLSKSLRVLHICSPNEKFHSLCQSCQIKSERKKGEARASLRMKIRRVEQAERLLQESVSVANVMFATLSEELDTLSSSA
eukprot:m.60663 g.60663  ORF g.60663 m.60663 type:complete len:1118 (+) comp7957_c0_seq1:138-3491(+)